MNSMILPIKSKSCDNIFSGRQTLLVQKRQPVTSVPFKCYVCRKTDSAIIGEFICDGFYKVSESENPSEQFLKSACMTDTEFDECRKGYTSLWSLQKQIVYDYSYADSLFCSKVEYVPEIVNKSMVGWHITNIVAYDTPMKLEDFVPENCVCFYTSIGYAKPDCKDCRDCILKNPPHSWCFVEKLQAV